MNDQELRELDAWIVEHVMGWEKLVKLESIEKKGQFFQQGDEIYIHDRGNYIKLFSPTTVPAAAMEVLKKCHERAIQMKDGDENFSVRIDLGDCPAIYLLNEKFMECKPIMRLDSFDELPKSICRFAKLLFSK